jgi:S-(hydroxymethyl)glutathione dehydrogenase / alcohol dehydrogenase
LKMRAAVLEEFAKPLQVTELDLAEPRPGEVLVRLAACGVCHTDMYTASGVDPSGYAPVMPEIALAKVSPEAEPDYACLFACGLSTGLGAAMNTAKVKAGSTCVVFGGGMVGLGAVAGCRLQGAERVICVDLSEERLELARGQGATETWVADENTVQRVLDETGGFGADYTFEATGLVAVMRQAVEAARMGWGLCTIAGVAGRGETLDVVPRYLITGRRICGSSFGGVKGRDQVPELVQLYLDGQIDIDPFISHRITLDEVNDGFELMERQDGIRSVITFG